MDTQDNDLQEIDSGRHVSRKSFLAAAGAVGVGAALAACGGSSDSGSSSAAETAADSAASTASSSTVMGPAGWEGAEAFQYTEDSAPGRAIMAAKQLKMDGKAPDTLVVGMYPGAIGNFTEPFPEGAKSVSQVWEEETGIKIKWVPMDNTTTFSDNLQAAARKDGSQNLVVLGMSENGDLANAGLLADLSDHVAKYQPDWDDATYGYAGGAPTTQMMNYFDGKPYAIGVDGDYQIWCTRSDLIEDSKEQADFKAKYDYDLAYPETWDQQRDIAEFFHRPDKGLLGSTDLRSPGWGWINFVTRYVSAANPVQFYWDDQMNPLINGPEGLKALNHLIDTTQFGSKDALTWIWEQQYGNWGQRGAAMTSSFSNLTKFMKPGSPLDPKDAGSVTYASNQPGWDVDGQLVRHSSIYFNAALGVNAFSAPEHQEAAYLLGQWLSSGQIYTWVTANPGGYEDICKTYSLTNPLVQSSYTKNACEAMGQVIPGSAPSPSSLRGAPEYIQALDVNLQKALSGQSSAEDTLAAIEADWNKITDKIGREEQARVWVASKAGWPTNPNTSA
jgi:multiple sugar transport system substrate-binding protein